MDIPEETYKDLKEKGYSDEDIEKTMQSMDTQQTGQIPVNMESSAFDNAPSNDLIKFQLELDNILERIEHILRGDIIKFDKDGNRFWEKDKEGEFAILNDKGVRLIMNILGTYITRNTILSNYKESQINELLYNLGVEINDLIFMKYEEIGMDTINKRKLYPSLVTQLVDLVRNSYTRALHGLERSSLREARRVMQTESIYPEQLSTYVGQPQQKQGFLSKTFGGGRV